MPINLKKLLLLIIVTIGVLSPVASAFLDPIFTNTIFKLFTFIIILICALVISISNKKRVVHLLLKPPTYFILYILLQSFIVINTANSSIRICISTIIFILPFLLILLVASLLTGNLDNVFLSNLLKLVLIVSIISMVIDIVGFGKIFSGKYAEIMPERLGYRQLHGFMPWPNVMATTLVVFSLLLYITGCKSILIKIGYLLTVLTLVRAHIFTAILLFVLSLKSIALKLVILTLVVLLATFTMSNLIIESSKELSSQHKSDIYRLIYITGAWDALMDYPFFGIGVNRMSNNAIWKMDDFKINTKYSLPTKLFSTEMSTSDTNVTFFAEIGMIGVFIYLIQLIYFIYLAIKVDRKKYILLLIPQLFWFYSFPTMLFSYNYGAFYWLLYGNLIAKYWESEQNEFKMLAITDCI